MRVTKYTHACIVLEDKGEKIIIDPGNFTPEFGPVDAVTAIVITHVHADHFDPEHLQQIIAANPEVVVFTTHEVAVAWGDAHATVVNAYEDHTAGSFSFRFFGEQHAEIHHTVPRPENIGVLVNDSFYYPGDSFVLADRDVTVLAVPASAPWLKIGDAMDFVTATNPKRCFPTHNALLSDVGHASANKWLEQAATTVHAAYTPLQPGESFEY